jgi:hypothetical protein
MTFSAVAEKVFGFTAEERVDFVTDQNYQFIK